MGSPSMSVVVHYALKTIGSVKELPTVGFNFPFVGISLGEFFSKCWKHLLASSNMPLSGFFYAERRVPYNCATAIIF